MLTMPGRGHDAKICDGCGRHFAYCGCPSHVGVTAEQWAALMTPRAAGTCIRCRFWAEADDVYIVFGPERVLCERCHQYVLEGDVAAVSKHVARDINAPEPPEWVAKPQGKDPRLGDSPYEVA